MTNTSATGGFLAPAGPPPAYDTDFDVFLQAVVAGVTGINGSLVRPRWQPTPPVQPDLATNWSAIGVLSIEQDNAAVRHVSTGDGHNVLQRTEYVRVLTSFYGPNALGYASRLRDGLMISQNREVLQLADVVVQSVEQIVSAPELINDQWLNRADMEITFSRLVGRTYPVLNLLSAEGTISADGSSFEGEEDTVRTVPWSAPPSEE